jgi:hypothetical protein
MSRDAQTLREELLGAEIVAGKELTEAAGGLFEGMERSAEIWRQQLVWLFDDYVEFWRDAARQPGRPEPLLALMERRSAHIATGVTDLGATLERECAPLARMWDDFMGVVRRDWSR